MSLPGTLTTLVPVFSTLPLFSVLKISSILTRITTPLADSAAPETYGDGLCSRCRYMTVEDGSKELWSDADFLRSTLSSFADPLDCLLCRFLPTDWVFDHETQWTFHDLVREVTEELIPSYEILRDHLY